MWVIFASVPNTEQNNKLKWIMQANPLPLHDALPIWLHLSGNTDIRNQHCEQVQY